MSKRKTLQMADGNGDVIVMVPKDQKFRQLANRRVPRAIKALRAIGNLSNRYSYEYTEDQSRWIIDSLQIELDDLTRRFSGQHSAKPEWSLD